ncbi:MAG: hypothetical protein QMC67_13620 [Candidatus Wallbacteria bacterium]
MKKSILLTICILILILSLNTAHTQGVSSDDFLPPIQAKTSEQSKQLLEVKTAEVKIESVPEMKTEAVVAPTTQDAINSVVNKHEIGCKMIKTGSGLGWVATGMVNYDT